MKSFYLIALLGLLLLQAGCGSPEARRDDDKARQKLDQILGDEEQDSAPGTQRNRDESAHLNPHTPQAAPQGEDSEDPLTMPFSKAFPSWLDQVATMGQPSIQVVETNTAYEIRIPVQQPQDANDVQVNVSPHRIEIAGQIHYGEKEASFQGSSSFMKGFNTSSEVLPNKVQRQVKKNLLLVTVPKKTPSLSVKKTTQAMPKPTLKNDPFPEADPLDEQQLSPEALKQIYQSGQQDI